MNKKKYEWIILATTVIGNIMIIYGINNSDYKIALTINLLGLSIIIIPIIIPTIYVIIKQKINLKKYGSEEIIKIEDVIIRERNIDKYTKILSNSKADICEKESLIEKFTIRVNIKTKTQELLKNVNELLEKIGYDLYISEDDIVKEDYEFIKNRRAKGYSTLTHDINVIINILNNYNLEVINIANNNKGNINMGIVSFDKLDELGEYDENIEE